MTLLVGTTAHAINMSLFKGLNYDLVRDFVPVTLLTQGPLVLVATPGFAAGSVRELIALAKTRPNTLNYASSGNRRRYPMCRRLPSRDCRVMKSSHGMGCSHPRARHPASSCNSARS